MSVEVTVDHELCQGAGQCTYVAPAVFEHDESGRSTVIDPEGAPLEAVLEAAEFCPNMAITVVVDGQQVSS